MEHKLEHLVQKAEQEERKLKVFRACLIRRELILGFLKSKGDSDGEELFSWRKKILFEIARVIRGIEGRLAQLRDHIREQLVPRD
jgi:hypothetical protein